MNWPMIVVGIFMFIMCRLIWKTIAIDNEVHRRIEIKKHFELLRELGVKPEHYYRYEYLIKHHTYRNK